MTELPTEPDALKAEMLRVNDGNQTPEAWLWGRANGSSSTSAGEGYAMRSWRARLVLAPSVPPLWKGEPSTVRGTSAAPPFDPAANTTTSASVSADARSIELMWARSPTTASIPSAAISGKLPAWGGIFESVMVLDSNNDPDPRQVARGQGRSVLML
ncbi:hypothetical protein AB0K12_47935 [Nonomuraea sp. NPDC049419]|uniref:hypothetical protein n=1 Tax=Nonomuraea sp. NPDC049419 TaxID=3155772 RepID=UPI003431A35F